MFEMCTKCKYHSQLTENHRFYGILLMVISQKHHHHEIINHIGPIYYWNYGWSVFEFSL